MLKAYKYRIYPNKQQIEQIHKTFGCCRFVYNQTLAHRKKCYEDSKELMNKIACNNYVNQILKKEYEWLKGVDKFALTNSVYNMDSAYQKFFKEHAGYPKFKSKRNSHKSYTTNKSDWNHRTYIKIGRFTKSSQPCNICGYINSDTKDLSIRIWTCPNCGAVHDRDVNAAKNILNEGIRVLNAA